MTALTTDEKWNAVVHCDHSYDGIFFYGVKTTGIVADHRVNRKNQGEITLTSLMKSKKPMLTDCALAKDAGRI